MSIHVTLYKLTDQGARSIREAPARIESGIKAWEAIGGKMLGFYVTEGEYDYVAITESPDEETARAFLLKQTEAGNVRSVTMRAMTTEEFADAVSRMPR
jgi:uncharacterized protein with GYD domain